MHVPAAWFAFLKEKVKDYGVAILLVETAARIAVISEAPRKVSTPRQRRLNLRPRFKLQPNATFAVDVGDPPHQVPQAFLVHPMEQQQQCLDRKSTRLNSSHSQI